MVKFLTRLTAGLFVLQLVHLYWLSADVVIPRLAGIDFFHFTELWQVLIVLVDYTEIPALIAGTLLYLKHRNLFYLLLINSQWLHLFWITDEFIIEQFLAAPKATILPIWLAWAAIAIDYLELPVIVDTIRKVVYSKRVDH